MNGRPTARPVNALHPKPVVPSEAPGLDASSTELVRLRTAVEGAIVDLSSAVTATTWLGPDADLFRARWYTQRGQLEGLQVRLQRAVGALHSRAIEETTRYRQQVQASVNAQPPTVRKR